MISVPDEIKALLHQDTCYKNIRIHFPNGERTDICNDQIVMDTVSFKESLCSQNTFKFGLAESPIFECEVVGVSNIKGATIEVFCEIYCPSTVTGAVWRIDIQQWTYPITYGIFNVFSCDRQADILHRKILAYGFVQNLNEGLSNFERVKLSRHNANYTPSGFLFALANYNLPKYDPEVFTPTTIERSGTEKGTEEMLFWTNVTTQETMHADFWIDTDVYSISAANADYLYHLKLTQLKTLDTIVYYFYNMLYQFCGYRLDRKYILLTINRCIEAAGLKYKVIWSNGTTYIQEEDTEELTFYPYLNNNSVTVKIPRYITGRLPVTQQGIVTQREYASNIVLQKLDQIYYSDLKKFRFTVPYTNYQLDFGDDFSNSKVFQAAMELIGCFGRYIGEYMHIINVRLSFAELADDELYPGTAVYPQGVAGASILPQDYQSCWYDENYTKPFGKVIIYYTDNNNQDSVAERYIGIFDEDSDIDSYSVYMITKENLLLANTKYYEADIYSMCYEISENIRGVTYMPIKLVGRGLPYVEPGDTFEVFTSANDSITTIVLSRTLKGEMVLTDEYVSVL